jgi:CheY-like chemotaxis protein
MDLRMPEMDGFEATREIRRLSIVQPPIVALTGDDDAETQQACVDAGMNGHLTKPIVFHDMEKMIASLTGG